MKNRNWYETVCNTFGKYFFRIPINEKTKKDFLSKLEFCDLKIEPNRIFSASAVLMLIGFVAMILLSFLGYFFYGFLMIIFITGFVIYLLYYPGFLVKYYRIKASSELVLCVFYMAVHLRLVPNLENAVKFASENLTGIVGKDLKRKFWDLEIGKYKSIEDLLHDFVEKWKKENLEFAQSMDVLRTSMLEVDEKREKMLSEAINVLLEGNTERMKNYTTQLKIPLMVITTFGITLPLLMVILFPMMTIFMAETIKPIALILIYNIALPIIVFWLMRRTLSTLPLQFGVIDISKHPDAHPIGKLSARIKGKKINLPLLPISILIGALICALGVYLITLSTEPVSLANLGGGIVILWGVAAAMIFYSFFSYFGNIEIRDEIKKTEKEYGVAIFELGHIMSTGRPMEKSLEILADRIKELEIAKLFKSALSNIKAFGLTLKSALFDEKIGVMKYYPSKLIRSISRIIVESLRKGVSSASKVAINVAEYLKSVHLVEKHIKESLDETTSSMKITLLLLVPIVCGTVVGMATITVMVLFKIVNTLTVVTGLSTAFPALGSQDILGGLVDIKNIMPAEAFLIVVGFYMLEMIFLLSTFLCTLEHGGDPLDKYKLVTQGILFGMVIFTVCVLLIFFIFEGLVGTAWIV